MKPNVFEYNEQKIEKMIENLSYVLFLIKMLDPNPGGSGFESDTIGSNWVALSFLSVDSNEFLSPFLRPFLRAIWVMCLFHPTQRNSACWKAKRNLWKCSLQSMCADMDWLPRRWASPPLPTRSEFVCMRARAFLLLSANFLTLFLLLERQLSLQLLLCERVQFDNLVDQDDLLVVNVVLYPPHVPNTSVLSSNYPCSRVLIPYYCIS